MKNLFLVLVLLVSIAASAESGATETGFYYGWVGMVSAVAVLAIMYILPSDKEFQPVIEVHTLEDLKKVFPLKAQVTQEIIDVADVRNSKECIGARTLKSVIPEKFHDGVIWGSFNGGIHGEDDYTMLVTTKEDISMMNLDKPREVTFTLQNGNY